MRRVYTDEMLHFLRDNYPRMLLGELTDAFNQLFGLDKSEGQIKACLKNHDIKCGRKPGARKGELRLFTPEQREWIQDAYQRMSLKEMVEPFHAAFGVRRTEAQLRSFTRNHRITSGRDGRFSKGSVPFNKGTKGLMKPNKTSFKKGHVPPNERPMWSERITKDGYIEIKIPEKNPYTGCMGRFVLKHLYVWRKAGRDLPNDCAIMFLDGDRTNCDLDNLQMIKRSELLFINRKFAGHHASMRPTIINIARLSSKSREVVG